MRPKINPVLLIFLIMLPSFMELLDSSVSNVILPQLTATFSIDTSQSSWGITAFLVASAIILPISGWCADFLGRKLFMLISICVFGVGSMLSGAATTFEFYLIARIIQGVGGGGILPVAQAILLSEFSYSTRAKSLAMGIYSMGLVVAPACGPFVGGWLSENYDWRLVYYINLPILIVSIALVYLFLYDREKPLKDSKQKPAFDTVGLSFLMVGISSLQILLDQGQSKNWFESDFIITLTVLAVVCLGFTIFWELRSKDPILNLRLFKFPNFASSVVVLFILGFFIYGVNLILPLYMQDLLGYSPMTSGLVVSAATTVSLVAMPMASVLVGNTLYKKQLLLFGIAVFILSVYLMRTRFTLGMGMSSIIHYRMIFSVSIGFMMVPVMIMSVQNVPDKMLGQATGMLGLIRTIGGSVGLAIVQTVVARGEKVHTKYLAENISNFQQNFVDFSAKFAGIGDIEILKIAQDLVKQQAAYLSFLDSFSLLIGMGVVAILVSVFFIKGEKRV